MNLYKLGILAILTLPIMAFNPLFQPPSWTKAIVLKLIVLVLLGSLIYHVILKYKKIDFAGLRNPIIFAFLLFFAVYFLASVFSVDPYFSFFGNPERGGGFINLVFYGLFGFLSFLTIQNDDWKKVWMYSIGVASVISLLSLFSFWGIGSDLLGQMDPRKGATIGNPIPFGIYLVMLLFMTASFFLTEVNKKKKIFYAVAFFLLLFSLFLTGSRGAYIGFLAGVFYFLIAYPKQNEQAKKIIIGLRIAALGVLLVVVSTVLYATYTPTAAPLLSENRIAKIILPRLSLNFLAQEERFKTWGTVIEAIKERPMLGWGPENVYIGFDKNFDPVKTPSGWWDRSHNTFLDAGAEAGLLGFIAYTTLFIVLFWQLYKIKGTNPDDDRMLAHGMQASLMGYGVSSIFSIDSFSTLLVFYLLSAYTLRLSAKNAPQENSQPQKIFQSIRSLSMSKKRAALFLFIILAVVFAWQYNIKPFFKNSSLNVAKVMAERGLCDEAMQKIENLNLPQKLLGQYATIEAAGAMAKCIEKYPAEKIAYSQKSLDVLEASLPVYPLSSRLWNLAGSIASTIAAPSEDATAKEEYLEKAHQYFQKALELSPKNQDTLLSIAQLYILKKDCKSAENLADQCLSLNPNQGACYWTKASSLICAGNFQEAEKNIALAKTFNFEYDSVLAIQQTINAYIAIENHGKVAELYELLIEKAGYYNVQYRASLAEAYRLSGQYQKAKEAALKIIETVELNPEYSSEYKEQIRRDVEAFLQTLPPQYR